MKCECGVVIVPPARICNGCGKDYRPSTKKRKSDDFRAFRRQVLLALISGDGDSYDGEESAVIKDSILWAKADRIASAEPKE